MKVSIVIVPLVFAVVAYASCPSAMPLSLCCRSLAPFSDNEYVWENVCGITVPDTSLLTAAGCESSTTWWVFLDPCVSSS